jgi:NAD(P)-dependent dehydrogenase (short-subunit alcohol dehydrogenase family)
LGLEWARQYGQLDWRVYASCRFPEQADDLQQLHQTCPNVTLHRLDVTHDDEIHTLAQELKSKSIDILLNNAGIYLEKYKQDQLGHIDFDEWLETFRVNTLGAMRVCRAFLEHVKRSDKRLVVAITSHMGSIAEIDSPGSYAYRSSKCALNAAMKGLTLEIEPCGIGVLMLHPGWVQTRMGGPDAVLTPTQSVNGMRRIIEQFNSNMSGHFYRYDGSEIPW